MRDQLRYSHIIRSLMYLASAIRPNISFAVSKLSRFVSKPDDDHWKALERVMRYLKGTMETVIIKLIPAILMNCDNQTVIVKVNSSKDNMKSSRHVKRRLKSVKKLKNSGVIALDYVQMAKNLANQFTKGVSRNVIVNASLELGMRLT